MSEWTSAKDKLPEEPGREMSMKKIICVILLVVFAILFCGCCPKIGDNYTESGRFILVSGDNPNAPYYENIIADKETGVMYLVVYQHYQLGITPLLNADGSPMTLDGINQIEEVK